MNPATSTPPFATLAARLSGDLLVDDLTRTIYSTYASEYQERPLAVAIPTTEADVRELVLFAAAEGIGLIPRAAGTSLAGQVVGHFAAAVKPMQGGRGPLGIEVQKGFAGAAAEAVAGGVLQQQQQFRQPGPGA